MATHQMAANMLNAYEDTRNTYADACIAHGLTSSEAVAAWAERCRQREVLTSILWHGLESIEEEIDR